MIKLIRKRSIRGIPSDSTSGKPVWIKYGYYWQEKDRYIKLLTKSHSVMSDLYYANDKSLVPWKENLKKKNKTKTKKLIEKYGKLTCPL
jgi:hypothetical protein